MNKLVELKDIAVVADSPQYNPNGYVICEDGMICSLLFKHIHGVILAILYPSLAQKAGYLPPTKGYDAYHYQRFEIDNSYDTGIIRVSCPYGVLNISRGGVPMNKMQNLSLSKIFKVHGVRMGDEVETDYSTMTAMQAIKKLTTDLSPPNFIETPDDNF